MLKHADAHVFCTRHHQELARHIVSASFGPIVSKVAGQLLSHGAASLAELGRETALPPSQLRNALLVLIQQNLVRSTPRYIKVPGKPSPPPAVQYEATLDEILVRPWFPRMVIHAREKLGADEELLLHELLVYGRLSSDDLVQRATESYAVSRGQAADSSEVSDKRLAFVQAMSVLRERRYMTQSDVLDSQLCAEVPDVAGSSGNAPSVSAPAPEAAKKAGRKRKADGTATGAAGKSSAGTATGAAGKKPAGRAAASGGGLGGRNAPLVGVVGGGSAGGSGASPVLWRANLPRLLWDFKHDAIKTIIADKLDVNAAGLVDICLNLQRSQHPYLEDGVIREPFTVDDVLQRCPQHFTLGGPLINRMLVLNYLDAMCSDPLCRMVSTLNGKYVLELSELSNVVKQLLLEGVVRRKVGEAGCRLYRLLLRKHSNGACAARGQQKMEMKMLAEAALLPEREARPLLWQLLQHGYVSLQEVARTADHNPKTTTYLWYVSLPHAYRALEEELTLSLVRMNDRLVAEQQVAERLTASTRSTNVSETSEEQKREAAVARARAESLEAAIARLSNTALLLRTM